MHKARSDRALCVFRRWVIGQGNFEVQPTHLANPTINAAVTTRMQVNTSVFCGIIFLPPCERVNAERFHARSVVTVLTGVLCV
jgi:hypothetical protein